MVAINAREVVTRAIGVFRTYYNRCLGNLFFARSTSLSLKQPIPKVVPLPLRKSRTQVTPIVAVSRGRKHGRLKRKGYNEFAKDNSTIFLPGGFRKEEEEWKKKRGRKNKDRDLEDDYEPIDRGPESGDENQGGYMRWANFKPTNKEQEFVMKELNSLVFDKFRRESELEIKGIAERVKRETPQRMARLERETREAEKLWKMEELERREEKESADRWKDQRLAQLEKEKRTAQDELAREKAERKRSRLQWVFQEQQRRHEDEERWKRMMEKDAKMAAEREAKLLQENVMLRNNLQATDNAFRRACNEREHVKREKEEERTKRIRAERSLQQWKELMKKYFPGGQQQQHPPEPQCQQPPPQPQRPLSVQAQFELYEEKWSVLRSGVDIDGSKVHLITFSQIPWPVINTTVTNPKQIQREHIQEFLMHPLRGKPNSQGRRKSKKMRVMDELKKWHSDKFDQIVLSKVRPEDKPAAFEAGGRIARILTDMLS